jgi:hypothetical protein
MSRLAKLIQRRPYAALAVVFAIWGAGGYVAPVKAQEAAEFESSLWVNVGGFSRHFDRSKDFNETNLGLGVEYRFRSDLSAMAGYHENSIRLRTRYAALNYQPLEIGPLKVGVSVGVMSGYPVVNEGGAFFAALPMVTYEGKRFGINFGVIPNIPSKHVDGAFVVQLKARAF